MLRRAPIPSDERVVGLYPHHGMDKSVVAVRKHKIPSDERVVGLYPRHCKGGLI